MLTIDYYADATANDFALFHDDVRQLPRWRRLFAGGPPFAALQLVSRLPERQAAVEDIALGLRKLLFSDAARPRSSGVWLFLAHGPWQDDNRVVNHRKIWRDVSLATLALPALRRGAEMSVKSSSGVRFAAVAELDEATMLAATSVCCLGDMISFILVSRATVDLASLTRELFEIAFPITPCGNADTHADWGALIYRRAILGDMLIKRGDTIDELGYCMDLFGRRDVLEPLQRHGGNG